MALYLELTSDLTLQSLNFAEIRLYKGQLLKYAEACKLIDKIGFIRYIEQVKPNACEVALKRSEICYDSEFRKRK